MVSREIFAKHMQQIEKYLDEPEGKKHFPRRLLVANPYLPGERDLQSCLSQLIECKEVSENNSRESAASAPTITEQDIYAQTYPYLIRILQERPLNGRNKDTRHELRLSALTILQLFQNQIYDEENTARYTDLIKL